jgi:hypothetical protein
MLQNAPGGIIPAKQLDKASLKLGRDEIFFNREKVGWESM